MSLKKRSRKQKKQEKEKQEKEKQEKTELNYELEPYKKPVRFSRKTMLTSTIFPNNTINTRKEMSKYSVVIAGCCRDIEDHVKNTLEIFDKIGSQFKNYIVVIFENDSKDNTRLELLKYKKDNYIYILENNIKIPLRTARIAYCRNKILNQVFELLKSGISIDYLMMSDMDDRISSGKIVETVHNAFKYPDLDWTVMTANQSDEYYDIWALRQKGVLETDCWLDHDNLHIPFSRSITRFAEPRPISGLIEVLSAFSAFAIYKIKDIFGCHYIGLRNNGTEVCEHVPFHYCLLKKGHKIYLNTEMLTV